MQLTLNEDAYTGLKLSADWINELESSDSRLHKERVIEKALMAAKLGSSSAQCFLFNCYQTYNPYYTFNIRQVNETEGYTDRPNPWPKFWALLEELRTRSATGNRARQRVQQVSELFDSTEWNTVCRRVLTKDLRCGISEKTLNKILGKTVYAIPKFSCQLATSCENRPEMKGLKRLEPKLDGVRVLMLVNISESGVSVQSFSRNGKVFDNFGLIELQIESSAAKMAARARNHWLEEGFVLDGEIVGNSFQELMRQARRKENAQADDSMFHIFDIIPMADFLRGHWNAQLHKRIDVLDRIKSVVDELKNVRLIPNLVVDLDTSQGRDQFQRYAHDQVAAGFEGIMIKDLEAPYECSRNTFWLKWKPTITVDLEVTDVEEGTGRNLGRLGALVCSGIDHGKEITVNVGSGFSDNDRDSFWNDRNLVIGQTVEILCDAITQNQNGTYSLRFPRFVRFRDDK